MGVIKTAERLTRRSYKRKIITLGISIFSALAMFATGFASWIISSDATAAPDGNVEVGVITDKSITIEPLDKNSGKFINVNVIAFEPAANDVAGAEKLEDNVGKNNGLGGRVYSDNDTSESLEIVFEAKITGFKHIGELTVKLDVPEGVKKAAAQTNAETGAKNYITLPVCASSDQAIKIDTTKTSGGTAGQDGYWTLEKIEGEDDAYNFTYTIKFGWGEFFGGMNPSIFYDKANDDNGTYGGEKYGYQVNDELQAFRSVLFTNAQANPEDPTEIGTFTLTVHASLSTEQGQ